MPRTLTNIVPLHPPLIPDPSWEIVGTGPGNKPLYRERSRRSRGVPDLDQEGLVLMKALREEFPDNPNGTLSEALKRDERYRELRMSVHRRWKLHPVNKEPLHTKNVLELFTLERTFFQESEGNGQVGKVFYDPPTPEELALMEREDKITEANRLLATALIDSGMTPEQIIERLTSGTMIMPTVEQDDQITEALSKVTVEGVSYPEDGVDYPQMTAKKKYRLSNGLEFEGLKADAENAELEVLQAREQAGQTEGY